MGGDNIEKQILIDKLCNFGLTRQEAMLYMTLVSEGELTGYEAAKLTGISRSNVYSGLAGLAEKGAALTLEGTATKYTAVNIEEFCRNKERSMKLDAAFLMKNMPVFHEPTEGYITISGDSHILNKVKNMLQDAKQRVYIQMNRNALEDVREEIEALLNTKKKVVILTDENILLDGAQIYKAEGKKNQIRLIVDSSKALTGEYGDGRNDTCIYSGQDNFIQLLKDALHNEIELIELRKV